MKKIGKEWVFVLLLAVSAFSQTELFDQDFSGIHPYAGLKWNSEVTQPVVGVEYIVEGRTALGIQAGFPLKDTLFSSPGTDSLVGKFKSMFINPYVVFELVEPGNLKNFSFLMRADYIYETAESDTNLNGLTQSTFGGGPIFNYAFQTSEKFAFVPSVSYEFLSVHWKRNWPTHTTPAGTVPLFTDEYFIQHNIGIGANLIYHLDETQGLNFAPRLVLKMGQGLKDSDLINVEANVGYSFAF